MKWFFELGKVEKALVCFIALAFGYFVTGVIISMIK